LRSINAALRLMRFSMRWIVTGSSPQCHLQRLRDRAGMRIWSDRHVFPQRTAVSAACVARRLERDHAAIDDEGIVRNLARAPWPYTENDARWFASQPQDERLPHF
jgi:hypothetical protein